MRSVEKLPRTYATLRFTGDRLDPDQITSLLGVSPSLAYRKGKVFKRVREREVIGRTNLWLFSTRGRVLSCDLADHLVALRAVLSSAGLPVGDSGDRAASLNSILATPDVKADLICFWRGEPPPPIIAESERVWFEALSIKVETDFQALQNEVA